MARTPEPDNYLEIIVGMKYQKDIKINLRLWLEKHKPLVWKKDIKVILKYTEGRGLVIDVNELEKIIGVELVGELVLLLEEIEKLYVKKRIDAIELRRKIKDIYMQLSVEERVLIEQCNSYSSGCYDEKGEDVNEVRKNMNQIKFTTIEKFNKWLAKEKFERLAILKRTISLLDELKKTKDEWNRRFWEKIANANNSETEKPRKAIINIEILSSARITLGVLPGADEQTIKLAYRNLVKKHHPDAGGDEKQFIKLQAAYELLIG